MMPALQSWSTRRSRKYDPCRNTSPYDACLAREQIIRHEALTENLSTVLIGGSGTEFGKKYLDTSNHVRLRRILRAPRVLHTDVIAFTQPQQLFQYLRPGGDQGAPTPG